MQNPYINGRKTSNPPYERLNDSGTNSTNPRFRAARPDSTFTTNNVAENSNSAAPNAFVVPPNTRRYSYLDDASVSNYAESVGAQSVPSYESRPASHHLPNQTYAGGPSNPYLATNSAYPTHPQSMTSNQAYSTSAPLHPANEATSPFENVSGFVQPSFSETQPFSEAQPSFSEVQPFPEVPKSAHYLGTEFPNHSGSRSSWNLGSSLPEDSLITNGDPGRPLNRRRKSSLAGSIRKYFDTENQLAVPNPSQVNRGNSVRHLFGLQRQPTISEYADENEVEYQIPIHGDEYQLNTWDPTNQHLPPHSGSMSDRGFDMHADAEGDLGQGYENYGSNGYGQQPLAPWEEEQEDEEGAANWDEKDSIDASSELGNGNDNNLALQTIELFRGNLVLDCPVSAQLLEQYPEHRPVREFTHMRYTAATCDPVDFVNDQYTLRQMCYTQPRETELMICVTVYNEDDILLARTLQGVFNNIRHLCHRERSSVWGVDAWKKVVVCIIADGRAKLNPRAKALMAALGAYQEGFAKNMVNDRSVVAHLYEYTSMVRIKSVSEKEGVKLTTEKATPVQLLFCMKEKNQKKINSHRWFFQAFGEVLKPNVCVLLDSGTRPGNHAIYHLWKEFHRNQRVAGACGEIAAMLGPGGRKLLNPLVATQNFEYKMSNILDKPSESVFGFITVLPGAFSAYRYEALQNHPNGSGPLEKYFKGEKLEGKGSIFQANMYLAEDRILCWELVSKRGHDWLLKYVKSAKAHTDVPEGLSELILQRRRWLNGSFFAQIYSLVHCFGIWRSGHSFGRKLAFHIQFLYQLIALLFSWFSLANFFLVFHILTASVGDPSASFAPGKVLSIVLTWVYVACIITAFVLSFGNRPQGTRRFYDLMVVFFSLLMAYIVFVTIYISVKGIQYAICANGNQFEPKLLWTNSTFRDLIISLLCTYALYFVGSVLFFDPWHVFTSMFQYVLLSPAYVNILNVYAFCNTHDISWGTKGDTTQKLDLGVVKTDGAGKLELELPTSTELVDKYYLNEVEVLSSTPEKEEKAPPSEADQRPDYYALVRSMNVLIWALLNVALIVVVLNTGGFETLLGDSDSSSSSSSSSSSTTSTNSKLKVRASQSTCQELASTGTLESQIYMAVVFWSVAAMAAYRFLLSVIYLVFWLFRAV